MAASMVANWTVICYLHNKSSPVRYSILEKNRDRMAYLKNLYCGQDSDTINLLRMSKDVFFNLCTKLHSMHALRDTWHCSVEEQVATFLQTVGHKKKNRDKNFHFSRSTETISRYFNEVLYAIGQLGPEMLRHRSTDVLSKIQNNTRFYPYFEVCFTMSNKIKTHDWLSNKSIYISANFSDLYKLLHWCYRQNPYPLQCSSNYGRSFSW